MTTATSRKPFARKSNKYTNEIRSIMASASASDMVDPATNERLVHLLDWAPFVGAAVYEYRGISDAGLSRRELTKLATDFSLSFETWGRIVNALEN